MKKSKLISAIIMLIMITTLALCACTTNVDDPKTPSATPAASATPNTESEILESTPAQNAIVTVESKSVSADEEFVFLVSVSNATGWNWSTFEFDINYNPEILRIDDIKRTEYTKGMSMFETNLEKSATSAKVAAVTAESFIDDGGALVEVHCTALAQGECNITLTNLLMYRVVTSAATNQISSVPIGLDQVDGKISVVKGS